MRYGLRATGQTLVFDGFIRIYKEGRDDTADPDAESTLPELTAEQALRMLEVLPEQHFTQPPPRFSEASLVKTLEELGIGRPSTYASIISTIQDRGYVRLEDKRFYPEDVGHGRDRQADRALPRRGGRQLHRAHGGRARRDRRGRHRVDAGAPRVQRAVRAGAREGRALVRALRGGARRALPALSQGGARAGQAPGEARPVRQVHRLSELPGVPLHPQHGRQRAPRARAAGRDVPRVRRPQAAGARRPVRPVRRLQRVSRVPLHPQGPAGVHRRRVSRMSRRARWSSGRTGSARRSTAATATPSARSR